MAPPTENQVFSALRRIAHLEGLTPDSLLREPALLSLPWLAHEADLLDLPRIEVLHAWLKDLVLELTTPPKKRLDLAIQAAMNLLPAITSAPLLKERQMDLTTRLDNTTRTIERWTVKAFVLLARRLLDRPHRALLQRAVLSAYAGSEVRFRLPSYSVLLAFDAEGQVKTERQRYELVALADDVDYIDIGHAYEDTAGGIHDASLTAVRGAEHADTEEHQTGVRLSRFQLPRKLKALETHIVEIERSFEHPQNPYYLIATRMPLPRVHIRLAFDPQRRPLQVWKFENVLRSLAPLPYSRDAALKIGTSTEVDWVTSVPDPTYTCGVGWRFG